MIVVDASVAIKWSINEPGHSEALEFLEIADEIAAPDVIFAEVANVLRKRVKGGVAQTAQAFAALAALQSTLSRVEPSSTLHQEALKLSLELDHSAYDCFYLAMAMKTGRLVTADETFVRKCRAQNYGEHVSTVVEMIANLTALQRNNET